MKTIGLNGRWQLSWDELGKGSPAAALKRFSSNGTIPAAVPGSVHQSLIENGTIEEPLVGLNVAKCGWIEKQEWWFIREFGVTAVKPGEKFFLRFDGVDLTGKIWLNGTFVGTTDNAFVEFRFDVTGSVRAGKNVLIVRVDEGLESVRAKSVEFTRKSWNNDQPYRAWMRKPQFCYGWDWTVRLPTIGIWKPVRLERFDAGRIVDPFVRIETGGPGIRQAREVILKVTADIDAFRGTGLSLECRVSPDPRFSGKKSRVPAFSRAHVSGGRAALELAIRDPRLWWPNGLGQPYLYTIELALKDGRGRTVDENRFRYGIRTVGIEERELGKGHRSFTFVVNGEPVFAKGANWVPVDAVLGRITDAKYTALVKAAHEAGVNMFRVWGGGVYEAETFFDLCDSLGIMVWHDFMYSCGYYPSFDRGFRKNIGREAERAIKRLRNRASLAGWAGNNEIQCMYQGTKRWNPGSDLVFHGEDIYEEILPGLVRRFDPDRPYRPGCPYGGYPSDSGMEGDQHTWRFTHVGGHKDYLNLWMHTEEETKFLSEFGVLGPMGIETAERCLTPGNRRTDSAEWHFHSNSYMKGLQAKILRKYFGPLKRWGLRKFILRGQALQAELMRYIYEELRSRKWHCSGALVWSWSDSFGTNGWALIDYYLRKKPAYYYFKRALASVAVTWSGYNPQTFDAMRNWERYYGQDPKPLDVLVMNDTLERKKVSVECSVQTFEGRKLRETRAELEIPGNSTRVAISVDVRDCLKSARPEKAVLLARLSVDGRLVHENRYFFVPLRDLRLQRAEVAWRKRDKGNGITELILISDTFVWMFHLDAPEGVEPLDNDFDLVPGIERIVLVNSRDAGGYFPGVSSLNPGIRLVEKSRKRRMAGKRRSRIPKVR